MVDAVTYADLPKFADLFGRRGKRWCLPIPSSDIPLRVPGDVLWVRVWTTNWGKPYGASWPSNCYLFP